MSSDSRKSDSGKGDRSRVDDHQKFRDGWDKAFGKKKSEKTKKDLDSSLSKEDI